MSEESDASITPRPLRWYSLSAYQKCIDQLGIAYPADYVINLLVLLDELFIRETNPDNIWWNGKSDMVIGKVPGAYMTNDDIDTMMARFVRHHDTNTKVFRQTFLFTQRLKKK